jgi:hypothetical protein
MNTHFLRIFIQRVQEDYKNQFDPHSHNFVSRNSNPLNNTQYQIPALIPDNCSVEIGHIDLESRPTFNNGQWTQSQEITFPVKNPLPMKKRTFKNIDLNNDEHLTMLDEYYSVVKNRSVTESYKNHDLVNGTRGISIRHNNKNPNQGTMQLYYEFSINIHYSPLGSVIDMIKHSHDTLKRTSLRISFPVQK